VFADGTSDLRPSNSAADALIFTISPEYFHTRRALSVDPMILLREE
jgi:hypothetical protein